MKILHIVRALAVGGLERVVLELVARSREHGHDVHIACLHAAGSWGEGRPDVIVLGGHRRWQKVLALARLARRLDIDILHSHNPEPHMVAVLAGLLCGIPVLHTKHGRNYPGYPRRVWINRRLARFTRMIVAVSDDAAQVAAAIEKVPSHKIRIIHNGIDVHRYQPGPKAGGAEPFTIGSVGRLSPEKQYNMLIDAFRDLHQQQPGVARLILVGDGVARTTLEEQARGLPVTFAGLQADPAAWLARMDVFCLCSCTEGLSMTLLEAGACGLPSVVTDVGGNREVVSNGETGFVVRCGDRAAITRRLVQLCQNKPLRAQLGQAARARIGAHFSMEQTVTAYLSLYREVAGQHASTHD